MPPAPRFARRCPPKRGLLVVGLAECVNKPPAPSALPPGVGRSRGFLDVCVLRQGASRSAMRFMRVPDANLDAQILAKKPTKLGGLVLAFCTTCSKKPTSGGQCRSAARHGGHATRSARPTTSPLWATNRPPDAKSAPLLRRSRNTGGPRTSDSEGRGGWADDSTRLACWRLGRVCFGCAEARRKELSRLARILDYEAPRSHWYDHRWQERPLIHPTIIAT